MPSIAELKSTCHNPVTQSTKNVLDQFYMKSAIYFSWFFIKLGLSANGVTVVSGLICLIGGVLLTARSIWLIFLGAACFILFHILDCSDGQISRYRKQSSLYGHFLDGYMHFVFDAAFFVGVGIGALTSHLNIGIALATIVAILVPIMYRTILYCGWTIICYERMNMIHAGRAQQIDNVAKIDLDYVTPEIRKKNPVGKRIRALIGPTLTVFFSSNAPYAFFILLIGQLVAKLLLNAVFDVRIYLIVYVAIVGPILIVRALRQRLKTNALDKNYLMLFFRPDKIELPRDYFFQ